MQYINLRELYPDVYKTDTLVEVTEEVMAVIQASNRAEAAYTRRMYRHCKNRHPGPICTQF